MNYSGHTYQSLIRLYRETSDIVQKTGIKLALQQMVRDYSLKSDPRARIIKSWLDSEITKNTAQPIGLSSALNSIKARKGG